ncbi:MAG: dTDP-4-dehydrorhamnose 3,5-epimerase [Thermoprotei archaeon]
MPFEFEELGLGVLLIKPKVFADERGFFMELFKSSDFARAGIPAPVQANVSFSRRGVVRGMHFQVPPKEQGKVVTVVKGRILDVALDVREGSHTYGKYVSVELSEENRYMLWIPPGLAHGFQALEDSLVVYFVTHNEYSPEYEDCVHYSVVKWPIKEVIVSEKDMRCRRLE